VKIDYITTNLITTPNISVSDVQIQDVTVNQIQELMDSLVDKLDSSTSHKVVIDPKEALKEAK
jgi:hypothetical protein